MSVSITVPQPDPGSHSQNEASPSEVRSQKTRWQTLLNALPNLIVFSMLGTAIYVGHQTGWKMPKISELRGHYTVAEDDWCAEHLVPESQCIECKLDLLPKGKPFGFCQKHGVNECVIDHPELSQSKSSPQLPKYDTSQAIDLIVRPENNSRNTLHTHRIQFTSAESVSKSGIDVSVVEERAMTDAIVANGEIMFDPTRVAHLSTRVPGTVAIVTKTLGDEVLQSDVLALVDAAQVGQAKSKLIEALVQLKLRRTNVERLQAVAQSGAVPGKSLIEAESALNEIEVSVLSAKQALANLGFEVPDQFPNSDLSEIANELRFLGIPKSILRLLTSGTTTANLIPIRAPYDGVVVTSDVVAGEVIDSTRSLFTIADPRRMWLMLNVRQEDARYVRTGLPVRFQTDDGRAEISGSITWVSPTVDAQTRTLHIRVPISNGNSNLRDHTFGSGRIILRDEKNAIVVPREAVQSTPDASFVFVRDKNYFDKASPKFFHVRQVRLGASDGQYVELLAGTLPGEVIATKGSSVLLAQLLRSNLGAGCGCHEH